MVTMSKNHAIETYNKLELEAFKQELSSNVPLNYASARCQYQITLETAKSIQKADLEACFNLIEYTSKSDYEQSTTRWRPRSKKAEMKHINMRYLLVRNETDDEISGFASFMLTLEDGKEVVYLYEIHLSDAIRGNGLGKHLIEVVSEIGKSASVAKIMLTVFVRNTKAVEWYARLGFTVDQCWPEAKTLRSGMTQQADYRILSRPISL